jgi:hypothetical protein
MDPELEALTKINEVIKDLPEDAKVRVVAWLINKYSIHSGQPVNTSTYTKSLAVGNSSYGEEDIDGINPTIASFGSAAELLAKCSPKTDNERVLIVAAYIQTKNPNEDLTGYKINHLLKNIGHEVSSINHRVDSLKAKKPQLMIQTKKSGNSKQGRKNYRVTDEGMKTVEGLLKS